jgi:photosystem II stability/assembly factor-like uncharacterized protein
MCALFANGNLTASLRRVVVLCVCWFGIIRADAADRGISLQGRVTTNNVAFSGTGKFKFALVEGLNGPVLWTHDGTSNPTTFEPTGFISIPVARGIYSTILGDRSIPGMTQALDPAIFSRTDIRVRIWFDDGVHNFQRLSPDQMLSAVAYAFASDTAREAAILTGNVTIGQVPSILVTNGATNVTFTGAFTGDGSGLVGIRGSTPFQVVSATAVDLFPNTGYLVTNILETSLKLPTSSALRIGDLVRVSGPNAGSWKITQNTNQAIVSSGFLRGIGSEWAPRDTNRAWTDIACSADGRVLVAAVSGGGNNPLYVSTNFGLNFIVPLPTTTPLRNWRTVASSEDGSRWVAGTDAGTLFVSPDFGQVWNSKGPSARNWTGVAVSADGSNMVAVASNSQIYTSVDSGDNWFARANGGTRNWTCVAASSDGRYVYAGASGDRLYFSSSFGTNWVALPPSPAAWTSVACSTNGQRVIAAVPGVNLITSTGWGTNFVSRTGPGARQWTAVACSADGLKLLAAHAGGLYVSIDGGENWNHRFTGNVTSVAASADARRLSLTVSGGRIQQTLADMVKSTTVGEAGYLLGDEASAVELQYIGSGKFFPISSSGTFYAY